MIKRHTTYCFEAKLKEIGKDTYYFVPFQVLAENQYVAKTILEEYEDGLTIKIYIIV